MVPLIIIVNLLLVGVALTARYERKVCGSGRVDCRERAGLVD